MLTGSIVFALTYVLITARRLGWVRLDRPSAAVVGAVACVALGVLAPDAALAAIDLRTLVLLFGMMGMGAFLAVDGFFERAVVALGRRARTRGRLLGMIVWGSGIFSALITNDAVCVLGAPLVVELIRKQSLPPLPYLLALTTASNTGSAATLVGNPQNMLCATLGGLEYRDYLLDAAPVTIASLALNHAILHLFFRRELRGALVASEGVRVFDAGSALVLFVIVAAAVAYTIGADLAWTAAGGCALLLVLRRELPPEEIWRRIDGPILLFFAGLFVVVEGFVESGAPAWLFSRFELLPDTDLGSFMRLAGFFLVGSNVVSNVPFILVVREPLETISNPDSVWTLLALASTFAGNLTLLGSVANIIVAERSRDVGSFGFWEHLRVGFPLALATTALAAGWVWLAM